MTTVKLTGNFLATARCLIFSDGGGISWNFNQNTNTLTGSATAGGTFLSSVGLADTSTTPIYTISNSPLTANGTLDIALNAQTQKTFFAGPTTGANAQPTFRGIAAADVPTLNQNTSGTAATATNLAGGVADSIPYQTSPGVTGFIGIGTTAQILQVVGGVPTWTSAGANPTNSVGLAAINGTATTFMRSDGAPALNVGITPTWTAKHTWTVASGAAQVLNAASTTLGWQYVGDGVTMSAQTDVTARGYFGTTSNHSFAVTTNNATRTVWAATGGVTFNAPGSGDAVTIANVAGANALVLAGNSAGTAVLRLNTQATTGAQTATFTATNKPGSGTTGPDKWIPINLDGTTHYIPAFL